MNKSVLLFAVFCGLLLSVTTVSAVQSQYDYNSPPVELWGCFDYAMHYSQDNPEWGIVLISDHPRFRGNGNSHFVNYQIHDDILFLYDADKDSEYYNLGWQYDTFTFERYHFFIDGEIPTRHAKYRLPNAELVYNAL